MPKSIPFSGLLLLFAATSTSLAAPPIAVSVGTPLFENKIRPLLTGHCISCHSKAGGKVSGGLSLDSRADLIAGGVHGPALRISSPTDSLILKALSYKDASLRMPPDGPISPRERADFTEWVRQGAPDPRKTATASVSHVRAVNIQEGRKYWAFQPLSSPVVPRTQGNSWAITPIDSFILKGHQKVGLQPSRPADRRVLIRRACLDLTGVPPTPQQVDEFISDRSPDAYSRLIDTLLASPHYGERWGRHWLDIARFAESHGYEQDYDRPYAYHYRDFVIRALNMDLPFNTFVQWQLAGDEFAPDNPLALAATGFLAAGTHATQITKNQAEKERYDELDDMAATTGTAFLALTVGCARCHDHKYDPIPNRDYYRLVSTFTTTVRSDMDVETDADAYSRSLATYQSEHRPLEEALSKYEAESLPGRLAERLKLGLPADQGTTKWLLPNPTSYKSEGGAILTLQADGSILASGKNPDTDTYVIKLKTALSRIASIRLEALADPSMVRSGPGRAANGNFALSDLRVTAAPSSKGELIPLKLSNPRATFQQAGLPVSATIDSDPKSGWAVDPEFGKSHAAVYDVASDTRLQSGAELIFTLKFDVNTGHNIGRLRISLSSDSSAAVESSTPTPELLFRLAGKTDIAYGSLSDKDKADLTAWYRTQDPGWRALNQKVVAHSALAPKRTVNKMLVCSEGVTAIRLHTQGDDFQPATYFLKRGDPNQKNGVATQGFLQVLMRPGASEQAWQETPPVGWRTSYRRRSLANWITDVDRGAGMLVARVIVNRLWQHHMGSGIVATPGDFGLQGNPPSNPALLEFLACELVRNGWKLKPIHKLIMMSAVYKQSSAYNSVSFKADPENRLYWRHSRTRLEAEAIRDSLLSVSGVLDETMYGPGSLDDAMLRRSIYFTIKRSRLIPMLRLFDGPDSLQGVSNRTSTTVAPQALLLMNDPNVRKMAVSFTDRVMKSAATLDARVISAYKYAFGRTPTAREQTAVTQFVTNQAGEYRRQAATASEADRLAMQDFCQSLLALNEFVFVD